MPRITYWPTLPERTTELACLLLPITIRTRLQMPLLPPTLHPAIPDGIMLPTLIPAQIRLRRTRQAEQALSICTSGKYQAAPRPLRSVTVAALQTTRLAASPQAAVLPSNGMQF